MQGEKWSKPAAGLHWAVRTKQTPTRKHHFLCLRRVLNLANFPANRSLLLFILLCEVETPCFRILIRSGRLRQLQLCSKIVRCVARLITLAPIRLETGYWNSLVCLIKSKMKTAPGIGKNRPLILPNWVVRSKVNTSLLADDNVVCRENFCRFHAHFLEFGRCMDAHSYGIQNDYC